MTATNYFQTANKLKKEGKLEEAIASYRTAIEQNPNFYWSYHNLGEVLAELGKWDEAVTHYRKAIDLNPNSAWSHYYLGEALMQLGKWGEAVAAYRSAIEIEPKSYQFHNKLGETLYQISLKIDQESLPTYSQLTAILFQTHQFQGSETELCYLNDEIFLQANDNLKNEYFIEEVYRTYLKREADRDGENHYQRELENGMSRKEVVVSFRNSQEFKNKLLVSLRKIHLREINDNMFLEVTEGLENETFIDEIYHTYLKRESDGGGKSLYSKQLETGMSRSEVVDGFRNSPEFSFKLIASVKSLYLQEAFLVYQNIIKLNSASQSFHLKLRKSLNLLAESLRDQGYSDKAVEVYKKGIWFSEIIEDNQQNQKNSSGQIITLVDRDSYFYLANTLLEQGLLDQAVENYQKVICLDPNFAEPYYYLGEIFSRQGSWDQALDNYQKAISIQPVWLQDLGIASKMLHIFKEQGKVDEVLTWLEYKLKLEDF